MEHDAACELRRRYLASDEASRFNPLNGGSCGCASRALDRHGPELPEDDGYTLLPNGRLHYTGRN